MRSSSSVSVVSEVLLLQRTSQCLGATKRRGGARLDEPPTGISFYGSGRCAGWVQKRISVVMISYGYQATHPMHAKEVAL